MAGRRRTTRARPQVSRSAPRREPPTHARTAAAPQPRSAPTSPSPEFREGSVRAKTGRSRDEWFGILDEFGSGERGHRASAEHLMARHGVAAWWAQAITVEYERSRGLRAFGERPDGFAVSVQRALAATPERVWEAWTDVADLRRWLAPRHRQVLREGGRFSHVGGAGEFRRIVERRFLRFTWEGPRRVRRGVVEVEVRPRLNDFTTVRLTHLRIGSAEEREAMRQHWSRALDSLKSWVERGEPIAAAAWRPARA